MFVREKGRFPDKIDERECLSVKRADFRTKCEGKECRGMECGEVDAGNGSIEDGNILAKEMYGVIARRIGDKRKILTKFSDR